MLFPTTLVGSYPQPEWLIDRKKLAGRFPPRVRAKELWRIPEEFLEEAWQDATVLAIHAQERAGIDIISDGEMRRESYSNRFATALDGVDLDNPGEALDRSRYIIEIGTIFKSRWGFVMRLDYRGVRGGMYDDDNAIMFSFQDDH